MPESSGPWISLLAAVACVGVLTWSRAWAVERDTLTDDLVTYRDLRVVVGLNKEDADGGRSTLEFGYVFDRKLEFVSGQGDYRPEDTLMIRSIQVY